MNTDHDWERLGAKDPFWAVITLDKYRAEHLSDEAIAEFYGSGDYQVNWIIENVRRHVVPEFTPRSALDFGCGVGRLSLALARRCERVVGVDVSSGMLEKAQLHADRRGIHNLTLVKGDLAQVEQTFDLVVTFIVLQHIPVHRGEQIFRQLLERIADGGVGALHVTYSRADIGPDLLRAENAIPSGEAAPAPSEQAPHVSAEPDAPPPAEPKMQMNGYDLNRLFHDMQQAGVRRFHTEFTDHGGSWGVMLFFQKRAGDRYHA